MMSQHIFNQGIKIIFLVDTINMYEELDIEAFPSQQEKKCYNIFFSS